LAFGTWHLANTEYEQLKDFRDLRVWVSAHELTLKIYSATANFPKEELYGLTSQIRRCSASIAANIAEGCGRRGNGEFHRFLQIAAGSASELDYHLLLANDLKFLKQDLYQELYKTLLELRRMLTALITKVEAERTRGYKS
jgi:four helix bundle protein